MKSHKSLIKVVGCILVTLLLYSYLCLVVSPKSINDLGGKSYYRGMGFLAEPKNSLNVMVYGNSDLYSGYIPALMYKKFGYTSYASGVAAQNIKTINRLLRKTLRTQKPKVVILEVDCLYDRSEKIIDDSNFFVSPFMYHARWKELKPHDFYTFPSRRNKYDVTKGFVYSDYIYKFDPGNYMGKHTDDPQPMPHENLKHVKHFIEICKRKNIKVIFLGLPSTVSWNYSKHNFVKELAHKNNIPFIDLNIDQGKFKVDFNQDFRDNGNHMNVHGAKKATLFIGEYLKNNYSSLLTDNRNKVELKHWIDVVRKFNEQVS